MDNTFSISARPFGIAHPLIFHTPIFGAERRGGSDLNQVEVICALEKQCCLCQRFGVLVIYRKMTPECDRWPVKAFLMEAGLNTFFMSSHGICLIIQNNASPRAISKTDGASLKTLRSSFVRVLMRT